MGEAEQRAAYAAARRERIERQKTRDAGRPTWAGAVLAGMVKMVRQREAEGGRKASSRAQQVADREKRKREKRRARKARRRAERMATT